MVLIKRYSSAVWALNLSRSHWGDYHCISAHLTALVQRSRISDAPDSAAKPRSTTRILKTVLLAA
jgi:hypothetical protein